eukprot:gene12206-15334_t
MSGDSQLLLGHIDDGICAIVANHFLTQNCQACREAAMAVAERDMLRTRVANLESGLQVARTDVQMAFLMEQVAELAELRNQLAGHQAQLDSLAAACQA